VNHLLTGIAFPAVWSTYATAELIDAYQHLALQARRSAGSTCHARQDLAPLPVLLAAVMQHARSSGAGSLSSSQQR
jgi:hypothetical protein